MLAITEPPKEVWGHKIEKVEHQADVYKLMVLLHIGGVYIDCDVVMVNPVLDLSTKKQESTGKLIPVFGEETSYSLSNGFIMSPPNNNFLKRLYWEYQHYDESLGFGTFSVINDWAMWRKHPSEVHVVKKRMYRPNAHEAGYLFNCLIDWRKQYVVHLNHKMFKKWFNTKNHALTLDEVATANSTLGEISRYVLWGDYHPRRQDCTSDRPIQNV